MVTNLAGVISRGTTMHLVGLFGLCPDGAREEERSGGARRKVKSSQNHKGGRRNKGLLAIAIFKWTKGLILLLAGVGFLKLLHHDVATYVEDLLNQLRVDSDNRYLWAFLSKLDLLDDKKIETLGVDLRIQLFPQLRHGLFLEQRWAEYLTIVATASFIPVEIYELLKGPSFLKCAALVVNVAIALFLTVKLWQSKSKQ